MVINISSDFAATPGGRFSSEGEYSGQAFLDELLYPKYVEANKYMEPLLIMLDGGYGYGPSFLEEAFGGLARRAQNPDVLDISFISVEEPKLRDTIWEIMYAALKEVGVNV